MGRVTVKVARARAPLSFPEAQIAKCVSDRPFRNLSRLSLSLEIDGSFQDETVRRKLLKKFPWAFFHISSVWEKERVVERRDGV